MYMYMYLYICFEYELHMDTCWMVVYVVSSFTVIYWISGRKSRVGISGKLSLNDLHDINHTPIVCLLGLADETVTSC